MIAFIVRVHEGAEGLAGVVEFPGAARAPFRSGDELVRLTENWLVDAGSDADRPTPTGDR